MSDTDYSAYVAKMQRAVDELHTNLYDRVPPIPMQVVDPAASESADILKDVLLALEKEHSSRIEAQAALERSEKKATRLAIAALITSIIGSVGSLVGGVCSIVQVLFG